MKKLITAILALSVFGAVALGSTTVRMQFTNQTGQEIQWNAKPVDGYGWFYMLHGTHECWMLSDGDTKGWVKYSCVDFEISGESNIMGARSSCIKNAMDAMGPPLKHCFKLLTKNTTLIMGPRGWLCGRSGTRFRGGTWTTETRVIYC